MKKKKSCEAGDVAKEILKVLGVTILSPRCREVKHPGYPFSSQANICVISEKNCHLECKCAL